MNKELISAFVTIAKHLDKCGKHSTTRDFIETDVKPVLIRAVTIGMNHLEYCTKHDGKTREDHRMIQKLKIALENEGVDFS